MYGLDPVGLRKYILSNASFSRLWKPKQPTSRTSYPNQTNIRWFPVWITQAAKKKKSLKRH